MDEKYKLLANFFGEERFKFKEKLSAHTHLKLEGEADCFYIATNLKELIKILDVSRELQIPYQIIGAGTKFISSSQGINALAIKNRTSGLKIAAIKGKVGRGGIGIQKAVIEADSGVSLGKLNQFLNSEGLEEINGFSLNLSTLGGSVFLDPGIRIKVKELKVWEQGEVFKINLEELNMISHIVLTVYLEVSAKDV